ncbi:MAG: polyprenyl synthetase family protein, partial [Gammaproteobacteria bacterium]
ARGMAGGQMLDIAAADGGLRGLARAAGRTELEQLARIHRAKTGALIAAAARLGALASARADDESFAARFLTRLDCYAHCVGLAFQIADDVLDVTATAAATGKRGGGDRRMQKTTYASALGVAAARAESRKQCRRALQAAASLGDNANFLMQLARFAVEREF